MIEGIKILLVDDEKHFLESLIKRLKRRKQYVKTAEFGKGDFVTFPKGLSCVWDIKAPVKKHYNFK